jgi:hypothetical protein
MVKQTKQRARVTPLSRRQHRIRVALGLVGDIPREEFAAEIRSFVAGTSGEWDWDDLTSIMQRDPALEAIRIKLINIRVEFPAAEPGRYCNDEGMKEMLRIADYLDSPAHKEIENPYH